MSVGNADEVLRFWFVAHGPADWFAGKPEFDAELAAKFAATHAAAARGEAHSWRTTPRGRLAEIIVLDQFSRQLHRGAAKAFAQDGMALVLAQEAVARGADAAVPEGERMFLYMPYMHAESLMMQEEGLILFGRLGQADALRFAQWHREVIARFGRFPLRNAALGRLSTAEEQAYMAENAKRGF